MNKCIHKYGMVFFLIVLGISGLAMSQADFRKVISLKKQRTEKLMENAQAIRDRQPDFAEWVACQQDIFRNFANAARFDFQYEPKRLPWTLADWDKLLTRMEEECRIYAKLSDPALTGRINIKDLGAKGDGIFDDAPVIRKALKMAQDGAKKTVFIPAGRYLLKPIPGEKGMYFDLKNVRNILIIGEPGTVLITESARGPLFRLTDCENV